MSLFQIDTFDGESNILVRDAPKNQGRPCSFELGCPTALALQAMRPLFSTTTQPVMRHDLFFCRFRL